jgi:hypothetical protein
VGVWQPSSQNSLNPVFQTKNTNILQRMAKNNPSWNRNEVELVSINLFNFCRVALLVMGEEIMFVLFNFVRGSLQTWNLN